MKIAIYGKTFNQGFIPYINQVFELIKKNNCEALIFGSLFEFIKNNTSLEPDCCEIFNSLNDFPHDIELVVSIGGDGTFLDSFPYALKNDIPVIGINSGRLGFLANISKEEIASAFEAIFNDNYKIGYRSLLKFSSPPGLFHDLNFALNEITIQKQGLSMISINVYLDNEFLNTYWTDGLIISTATGSTAYSLSVGGPILTPGAENFILIPIASHNLTVRPVVVPDNLEITLKAFSRSNKFLITADNKTVEIDEPVEVKVIKSDLRVKILQLPNNSFYSTIRNKLMWGADKRN
jgi:NAD+ kinase